jgi:aspartate aminotransferase-like enzyme
VDYLISSPNKCLEGVPGFDFSTLYRRLSDSGYIIYPGKWSQADTFRIGSIGRIDSADVRALLRAIEQATRDWRAAAPTGALPT